MAADIPSSGADTLFQITSVGPHTLLPDCLQRRMRCTGSPAPIYVRNCILPMPFLNQRLHWHSGRFLRQRHHPAFSTH